MWKVIFSLKNKFGQKSDINLVTDITVYFDQANKRLIHFIRMIGLFREDRKRNVCRSREE